MMSLDDFVDGARKLIDTLETIIRGGACDLDVICLKIEQMIHWVSSDETSESSKLLSEAKRRELTTLAVKVNTKSRTLMSSTSNSINKLRTLAKVLSGWIVFQFNEPTVKAFQVIIPILNSALADVDKEDIKLICCQGVTRSWNILNDLHSISSHFSALQLHDLKVNVYESLAEESRLHILIRSDVAFERSRQALVKSIEIVTTLEIVYSVSLAEKIFSISSLVGSIPMMLDQAKHFYLLTMNVIQQIRNRSDYKELKSDTQIFINELKMRISLALAYIDMENG
jgi:hypothetical protein